MNLDPSQNPINPFDLQIKVISKKLVKFHFASRESCPMCDCLTDVICAYCGRKQAIGEVEFEGWVYDIEKPVLIKNVSE